MHPTEGYEYSWESFYSNSLSHLSSKKKSETKHAEDDVDSDDEYDSDDDDNDNDSDPGTSWFSEYKAPEKVLQFLTSASFPLAPCNTTSSTDDAQPTILDLGTGNGSMLTLLRDKGGFNGKMVGVDYSERSVELARQLLAVRPSASASADIRFETWDILASSEAAAPEAEGWFPADKGGFDIVLDKGTFDAVSLSAEEIPVEGSVVTDKSGRIQRRICERYPAAAARLMRPGGFLIVTSCNWTEEELIKWFTAANTDAESELSVWGKVEYVKFRFGGQEGQGVCTVCFQRRA